MILYFNDLVSRSQAASTHKEGNKRKWNLIRSKGRGKAPKSARGTEIIKDVYLLPNKSLNKVPRKSLRKRYFESNLVVSALR